MKAKIIYISAFLGAFIVTTLLIIYFSSIYQNIFKFDFTPALHAETKTGETADSAAFDLNSFKNYINTNFKKELIDTLRTFTTQKVVDTVITTVVKDSTLIDSLKFLEQTLKKIEQMSNEKIKAFEQKIAEQTEQSNDDSSYFAWKKKTAGLYESMDPKKAAKIIQNYSDNVARDILYSMKKNKAAEILAELKPDIANRITRLK